MPTGFPFVKGHGTENDFVILPDPDGLIHAGLGPGLVRALCDRRSGIGADGVLRAVRAGDEWFMDYRNADGSVSEMCGNGVRVFARYLIERQGVSGNTAIPVLTRAGRKLVSVEDGGDLTVDMGSPALLGESKIRANGQTWVATHVSMGNPHAVVFVESLDQAGPLVEPPEHDETVYPEGVNVEFVVRRSAGRLTMRVHERGSGETRSCGTGACAAVVAAVAGEAVAQGRPVPDAGDGAPMEVEVPGGTLRVAWSGDRVLLTGPAELVAEGIWVARR